jgi:hypothetical protein
MSEFENLWIKHAAASFDKQIYFDVMLGKLGWGLDLSTGVIAFRRPHEEPLQLSFQVLGTESEDSDTWLWGWANKEQGFANEQLMTSLELKVQGERLGAAEFTTPELPLSRGVNGARISAVASGLCRAGCYVRAAYPNGALFLLIRDPRFKRPVSQPVQRILRAFPMFLSDNSVGDHRSAFSHYLQFYKLVVTEFDDRIEARTEKLGRTSAGLIPDNTLIAEFDADRRLVRLTSELRNPPAAP